MHFAFVYAISQRRNNVSIIFGPAGRAASFEALGYKKTEQIPQYLEQFGLKAFEYQCGQGVRVSEKSATPLREAAKEHKVSISLHAPYYISMSGMEEAKRLGSLRYFEESARAIKLLGGERVIFHSGSCGKQTREAALLLALDTMRRVLEMLDENGLGDVILCPETMGKIGQLGDLEEVLTICGLDRRLYPCIDFGHLNARTGGGIKTKDDYRAILERIQEALPDDRSKNFHVHFSKIEYTTGGEKRHLTFEDKLYGPQFEPLVELFHEYKLSPTVICESDASQTEDAATMQRYYESLK